MLEPGEHTEYDMLIGKVASSLDCKRCQSAEEVLLAHSHSDETLLADHPFGTMKELETSSCPLCQMIHQHLMTSENRAALPPNLVLSLRSYSEHSYVIGAINAWPLCDFISNSVQPNSIRAYGILAESAVIDTRRVFEWLDICDNRHNGDCHPASASGPVSLRSDIILVDVLDGCLVQCSNKERYLTLNYVWGYSNKTLRTSNDNFRKLCSKQALWECWDQVAKTVQDAICLVRSLEQRYLWVDCLCIIQDDDRYKSQQIEQMDAIYANSYLTIVDVDGQDSHHGLPGVFKDSCQRDCVQAPFTLGAGMPCVTAEHLQLGFLDTKGSSRGWTFQEERLSNRILYLSERGMV